MLTLKPQIDPSAADPRETALIPADNDDTLEDEAHVLDSYESEHSYMHEDGSIDQTRMKDFINDTRIFRREPPVLLKVSQNNGVELDNQEKRLLPGRVFGFLLRSRT